MHRIKLIQLKEDKAWLYTSTEFYCVNLAYSILVAASKGRRCVRDVKIRGSVL